MAKKKVKPVGGISPINGGLQANAAAAKKRTDTAAKKTAKEAKAAADKQQKIVNAKRKERDKAKK